MVGADGRIHRWRRCPHRPHGAARCAWLLVVAIATSGRQRINVYKPIDEADRIDDWLYLPETLYAVMLIVVIATGAGPYSLDAVVLGLIGKHAA